MKTTFPQKKDLQNRKWYLIDAENQILGKIATRAATILRGKHKPIFSPHLDCGDHVIIINSQKLKVTGNKLKQKIYYTHSGYLGNLYETPLEKQMEKNANKVIEDAISGMIPRNRLKKHILSKLKVYKDTEHKHEAQQPETITLSKL
ncbi:50S ribosomal protein L13 [Candidatus Peregrinibacteria bacterium RIFOXYA2_FULL_33_7]|nr:MAG: 50S ribosomal protein L13, large subunit ribosomal protein L13 [Candidatus Peregrinibacteria bacterium GW2011_GWC2_33_13]OGJ47168.1 MAG: 50S ribosomal protein L13 [Candidatus Peregrinibacteria bacterium RIFOXYA2_FULL_33_7]